MADNDAAKTVRPVAAEGVVDGYLDQARISWGNNDRGRGPTGTAVRTGRVWIGSDLANDPQFAPWSDQALKRGYRSSIALPLVYGGENVRGFVDLRPTHAGAFDDQNQVDLLHELAEDLAFGIVAVRARSERDDALQSLKQRTVQLHALAAELIRTEERERRRLAKVLHDHLQQLLVGAQYGLDILRSRSQARGLQADIKRVEEMP